MTKRFTDAEVMQEVLTNGIPKSTYDRLQLHTNSSGSVKCWDDLMINKQEVVDWVAQNSDAEDDQITFVFGGKFYLDGIAITTTRKFEKVMSELVKPYAGRFDDIGYYKQTRNDGWHPI